MKVTMEGKLVHNEFRRNFEEHVVGEIQQQQQQVPLGKCTHFAEIHVDSNFKMEQAFGAAKRKRLEIFDMVGAKLQLILLHVMSAFVPSILFY